MRKKASFTALLYRKLLLCRKGLVTYGVSTLIFTLIQILFILSLRYGNLTMLPEHIVADIRANNDLMLTLYAVICPSMLVMVLSESSVFEAQTQWDRFRRSTPVKPAQMALAQYVLYGIVIMVSAAVSIAVMALCHGLLGSPMTVTDMAVIMAIIMIITMLCVLGQVFIMLLRSVDKGMLAMLGCSIAGVFLIPMEMRNAFSVEGLLKAAEKLLPLTPVILMGILLLGFGLTTFIYARREK